ncbi:hypothetical protein FD44_GL000908 [Secundilactobacillus malefermentans DSM 5705 = KCTC 3548]|nr:hypothetical protein FD44_GL000908 [Secundilactobacillus malefermentans DSM 5705 = KCTC 3548]
MRYLKAILAYLFHLRYRFYESFNKKGAGTKQMFCPGPFTISEYSCLVGFQKAAFSA